MEECRIGRVKDWKGVGLEGVGLGECRIESVKARLEECRIGRCRIGRVKDWKGVGL